MAAFYQRSVEIQTRGRGLVDVTREVAAIVAEASVTVGLCSVFVQHTSASLVIQENADPSVLRDLQRWMDRLAPSPTCTSTTTRAPTTCPATCAAR